MGDTFAERPDLSWAIPFVHKILYQVSKDFKPMKRVLTANTFISYFCEHLEFVKETVRSNVIQRGLQEFGPKLVEITIIEQMIKDIFLDFTQKYNAKKCYESYNFPETHPCPKCGVGYIKDGGCQYMTCPICNCHYCFSCMSILKASHASHNCKPIAGQGRNQVFQAAALNATNDEVEFTIFEETIVLCLQDLKIYNGIKANLYYILQEETRVRKVAKKAGGGCKYEDIVFLLNRIFHTIDLAIWIMKFLIWKKLSHVAYPEIFRICGCVRHKLQKFEYLLEDVSYESLNAENLIKYNESTAWQKKFDSCYLCTSSKCTYSRASKTSSR